MTTSDFILNGAPTLLGGTVAVVGYLACGWVAGFVATLIFGHDEEVTISLVFAWPLALLAGILIAVAHLWMWSMSPATRIRKRFRQFPCITPGCKHRVPFDQCKCYWCSKGSGK